MGEPPHTSSIEVWYTLMVDGRTLEVGAFTKPPLLQESRLTGGGSPNLVVLVEWKVSASQQLVVKSHL